jgi:tetratricopeptide (TPR) repeat protein
MNKKPAAARKRAPANPEANTHLASMKGSDKPGMSKPTKVSEDPRFVQAVQNYEAGLKAMQTHKYDRAKACFEKVITGASPELADRAAVHLNTCNQHLSRATTQFKTPEEQYDYAISLMNMGDYVSARENFETLISKHPKIDYIWYGMAALNCLMGHFPESITSLNEAIRLNPANRFQARNDSDFKGLADDPRFTELLYPDTSAELPADSQNWHF